MKLDMSRNRLLTYGTIFALVNMLFAFAAVVTGYGRVCVMTTGVRSGPRCRGSLLQNQHNINIQRHKSDPSDPPFYDMATESSG